MVTRLTHGMTAKRFNGAPQSRRRAILMLVVTTCLLLGMMPAVGDADVPTANKHFTRQMGTSHCGHGTKAALKR